MSTQDTLPLPEQEREAFISWLCRTHPIAFAKNDAECLWRFGHVAALAWQARAAIAAQAQQPATVKESLTPQQAQQAQGVLAGWRLAKVSDGDIRVYGPDKETWLIRNDCGEGFYEFIHRFFDALLAAAPQAEPAASAQTDHIVDANKLVEPHVWLYDFMDGATTVRNWSTTNKAEAFAPGNFNQRGYVPAEN